MGTIPGIQPRRQSLRATVRKEVIAMPILQSITAAFRRHKTKRMNSRFFLEPDGDDAHFVPAQKTTVEPPHSFAQWRDTLDALRTLPLSADNAAALASGTLSDPSFASATLEMIKRFVQTRMNAEKDALARALAEDVTDSDDVLLIASRYSARCSNLLFFRHVDGLPERQRDALDVEICEYMRTVLSTLDDGDSCTSAGDDIHYCLARLARQWEGRRVEC